MTTAAEAMARPTLPRGGFAELLDGFKARLERELKQWIAAKRATAASPEMLELVDGVARLATQGGKRLRPALVYYAYRGCGGGDDARALPMALATELLHTYLLIHDDIMDHAELRRGQPAAHVRFRDLHRARGFAGDAPDFGRAVGILLGDLAHTWAVEAFQSAIAGAAGSSDTTPRSALVACFSAMCEEVIAGQYLEMLLAVRRAGSEEELLRVLRLKSGRYTTERPVQLGALLAGAPAATLAALSRWGEAVGEAFQLQDDVLGTFGDAAAVGKPVGSDLAEGKYTFLIHHALAEASAADRAAIEAALGDPALGRAAALAASRAIERSGALDRVREMIEERLAIARAALDDLGEAELTPQGRAFLTGMTDWLGERRH